jgi:hypothetical protein
LFDFNHLTAFSFRAFPHAPSNPKSPVPAQHGGRNS